MNTLAMALLALAIGGSAGSAPPAASPLEARFDSLEALKTEVQTAAKAGALGEDAALAFAERALALVQAGQDAATRAGALELSYSLRTKKASPKLEKLREQMWEVVLEKDIDEGQTLAPLISQFVRDDARAAAIGKRTKSPEVKAACALVPLKNLAAKRDRSEAETKQLVADVRKLKAELGSLVDPRRKLPFAESCDDILFPIERLVIGAEVPDIEAKDTAGIPFKLSDYRGKVVLLDFWGNW